MAASLVLDDRTGHYPQPRGGRDGMCDGTKLRALCLFLSIEEARLVETDGAARGETELALYPQSRRDATESNRDYNRKQPRQQQRAKETTTGSNRYNNREQPRG